jgi:Flp pilus assembly protein TadD
MKFWKPAAGFTLLFLLQTGLAEQLNRPQITGKILYPYGGQPCDSCPVSLESATVPVETAVTDSVGNFKFYDVRPGSYIIHIVLDGFEEVEMRVDVSPTGVAAPATIFLNAKSPIRAEDKPGAPVLDVSELNGKYPKKAIDLCTKAAKSREKGDIRTAASELEEATRIAPNFYQAHDDLGKVYMADGRLDDAEHEFLTAKRLNDSSAEPLIQLTGLYIDRGQPELAVQTGEEAVRKDSHSARAFFGLGLAFYRISRLDSAEDVLKKALTLAPAAAQVRLLLANIYLKQKDWKDLRIQLDSYLAENPNGPERGAVEKMRSQLPPAQDKE